MMTELFLAAMIAVEMDGNEAGPIDMDLYKATPIEALLPLYSLALPARIHRAHQRRFKRGKRTRI